MQVRSCTTMAILLSPIPVTWSISLFPPDHHAGDTLRVTVIMGHSPEKGTFLTGFLYDPIFLHSLLIVYISSVAKPEKPTGWDNLHFLEAWKVSE